MMGERTVMQEALFYSFSLERHVPDNHMLRKVERFVDLSGLRAHLERCYSDIGRPSIDPELMIRMLLVGYCFGIRSERRLCEEVHFNLAYRWFCRLGLDGGVPDHPTLSKNRHGRFRESDMSSGDPTSPRQKPPTTLTTAVGARSFSTQSSHLCNSQRPL
jgi:transposase